MAIEKVRERLLRSTAALETAQLSYAVAGGNAVAEWVGRIDQAAVRFTQDVDLLVRREELPCIVEAMQAAGFVFRESFGVPFFLDDPLASPRDAVHLVYSGERVKPADPLPAPDVGESEPAEHFRIVSLEALVRMKLTAFRRKDQVHLQDMLDVGLIDATWIARLPSVLVQRLQELIDDPQ
jgi:hypothetical protein